MCADQSLSARLDEIAAQSVPGTVDLWPTIVRNLETRKTAQKPRITLTRAWQLGAITVGVLVLLTVIRPVRRTIADSVQHFGIVETDQTVIRQRTPAAGVTATSSSLPLLSLTEAQKRVPYTIPQPSSIPAGMHLRGVFLGSDNFVSLSYVANASSGIPAEAGFGLSIALGNEPSLGGCVFPKTAVTHVTVNGAPALYAHGSWDYQNGTDIWHGDSDASMLSWSADGFTFHLSQGGLGLSRDDLIRIAESVHS